MPSAQWQRIHSFHSSSPPNSPNTHPLLQHPPTPCSLRPGRWPLWDLRRTSSTTWTPSPSTPISIPQTPPLPTPSQPNPPSWSPAPARGRERQPPYRIKPHDHNPVDPIPIQPRLPPLHTHPSRPPPLSPRPRKQPPQDLRRAPATTWRPAASGCSRWPRTPSPGAPGWTSA